MLLNISNSRDTELTERIERLEKLLGEKSASEESSKDAPLILFLLFSKFLLCPLFIYNCCSLARKAGWVLSPRHLSSLSTINQFVGSDNNKHSTATAKIGTRITPTFSSSLGNLHFAGFKLRGINSYNSIPLFLPEGQQWIKSRTGQADALENLYEFGPPWQNQRNLRMNSVPMDMQFLQDGVHLPDREIIEELALRYSSHILYFVFPIIDKVLFQDTINLAYEQGSFQHIGHVSAKACIYAFLAFVSIFNIHTGSGTGLPLDSEAYALKAQSLIPQILQDITTESLQATLTLVSNLHFLILMLLFIRSHLFSLKIKLLSWGRLCSLAWAFDNV